MSYSNRVPTVSVQCRQEQPAIVAKSYNMCVFFAERTKSDFVWKIQLLYICFVVGNTSLSGVTADTCVRQISEYNHVNSCRMKTVLSDVVLGHTDILCNITAYWYIFVKKCHLFFFFKCITNNIKLLPLFTSCIISSELSQRSQPTMYLTFSNNYCISYI